MSERCTRARHRINRGEKISQNSICWCYTAPLSIDSHVVCEAAYASLHSLTIVPADEGAVWKFAFCFAYTVLTDIEAEKGLWDYFAVVLSAEGTMRLENVDVEVIVVVLWEKGDDSGIQ